MPAIIDSVLKDSIAEDLEFKNGDIVLSINNIQLTDMIEYKYAILCEELTIHMKRSNGEEEIIDIEKDFEEDLGIVFESAVFNGVKPCSNKCIFCFVDQQPKGLRNTLYIKDDDYRLSYLQGTYVTLTNLTSKDKARIETLRLGPLYVSVHTTNPTLRTQMLKNPKAGNILKELSWLNSLEIPVHTQIVLCPGFNDGEELIRTLKDLGKLKSNIMSIAVVPVGLTKYRKDSELHRVTKDKAIEVINQIALFNKSIGYNLAFASDEFYFIANKEYPHYNQYNEFGQLEDGVGASRILLDNFNKRKDCLPKAIKNASNLTLATGEIAAQMLRPIISELNKIENLTIDLTPIKSNFWGDDVTVAGLITGSDLIDKFEPHKQNLNKIIIPSVMIRPYSEEFLDNMTISDVENKLQTKLITIKDYYSCSEIIDYIIALK